jgi:hypothetical protein
MKERSFSIYDKTSGVRIEGGNLWQAKNRKSDTDLIDVSADGKTLSIFLRPGDDLQNTREALYTLVRQKSGLRYSRWKKRTQLPRTTMETLNGIIQTIRINVSGMYWCIKMSVMAAVY